MRPPRDARAPFTRARADPPRLSAGGAGRQVIGMDAAKLGREPPQLSV